VAAVGDTGISIRAARAGDAAALTSLSAELGYPGDERQVEQRFGWIARDPRQRIFVATDAAGAVVGWVHVNFGRWLVVNPRGEVMGLVVSSAMRGQGIGRQLMNAAETWTREQGGTVLTLRSNIVRKEAHAFYERLGYKVTKTSLNFSKNV
jgi:GNAT superfamily N-acetyltransferase